MELICTTQKYHWGKKAKLSLAASLAQANSQIVFDENETVAEFWMGTHANGPSYLKNQIKLSDYLMLHTQDLGLKVLNVFGNKLPFLFKVLSIEEPLSIQVHPTKQQAEELFHKLPHIYKDENHKPEIAIAVSKFEALCGFRPLKEIKNFLKSIHEFKLLINSDKYFTFLNDANDDDSNESKRLMKDCFKCLMLNEKEVVASAIEKLISRLELLNDSEKEIYYYDKVKKMHSLFPQDVGIFCIYWLNYLILSPGEALYLAPNEPHAYLHGDCVECMANSDNVIRAGLTPKFRDIETLCKILTYKNYLPSDILFKPIQEDKYSLLYSPPVKDFAVAKIAIPKNTIYTLKQRESASILLVFEGHGEINSTLLEFGKVIFLTAVNECTIKSHGIILFQAFCNISV